jgi:hypothetical protein
MEKKEFAKGIFITEKESKSGKTYLEIAIGENGTYKKYVAFKGTKEAKYGGIIYSVYDKTEQAKEPEIKPMIDHRLTNDLPF